MRKSSLFLVAFLFSSPLFAFSSGSGSIQDPYLIGDCQTLQRVSERPAAHFRVTQSFDCKAIENFVPISNFSGRFDGNGKTIRNLTIDGSTEAWVGLFKVVKGGAIIHSLNLVDVNITGLSYVGGLVGALVKSEVKDVFVSGEVSGVSTNNNFRIGGLIGSASESKISNSHTNVKVSGFATVGGLVGHLSDNSIISDSSADVIVSARNEAGGLVGNIHSLVKKGSRIVKSYAKGVVSGEKTLGGLIGEVSASNSHVLDSYANVTVNAKSNVGGLIGSFGVFTRDTTVINTYAAGKVSAAFDVGGLIGYLREQNNNIVKNSYWDITTSGQTRSRGGEGRTTVQMKQKINYLNWDFEDIWTIEEGKSYPLLHRALKN